MTTDQERAEHPTEAAEVAGYAQDLQGPTRTFGTLQSAYSNTFKQIGAGLTAVARKS